MFTNNNNYEIGGFLSFRLQLVVSYDTPFIGYKPLILI